CQFYGPAAFTCAVLRFRKVIPCGVEGQSPPSGVAAMAHTDHCNRPCRERTRRNPPPFGQQQEGVHPLMLTSRASAAPDPPQLLRPTATLAAIIRSCGRQSCAWPPELHAAAALHILPRTDFVHGSRVPRIRRLFVAISVVGMDLIKW